MKFRYLASPISFLLEGVRKVKFNLMGGGFIKILNYHDISPNQISLFKNQIQFLAKRYKFIKGDSLADYTNSNSLKGINILLTFDDGFKSQKIVAEEVLDPLGIKAVFFVCPKFVDMEDRKKQKEFISKKIWRGRINEEQIDDACSPLSWNDLDELLKKGHSIGSHTLSHANLAEISNKKELEREIIKSGDKIETQLGIKVRFFAYPFGNIESINKEALQIVRMRYSSCFSGIRGMNLIKGDFNIFFREQADPDMPVPYLNLIVQDGLSGLYIKARKKLKNYTENSM